MKAICSVNLKKSFKMNNKNSESELAEANFERFILDFSRENKLVSEIQRSKETIEKINQESLSKTKQKVEGF